MNLVSPVSRLSTANELIKCTGCGRVANINLFIYFMIQLYASTNNDTNALKVYEIAKLRNKSTCVENTP